MTRGNQAEAEKVAKENRNAGDDPEGQSASNASLIKEKASTSSNSVSVASWYLMNNACNDLRSAFRKAFFEHFSAHY
jgi:hypothetical protein